MDYFSEDSAHITNSFSLDGPAGGTLEDRKTHKRWARRLLALYVCLLLAGATAITVHNTVTSSGGREQHASLPTDAGLNH